MRVFLDWPENCFQTFEDSNLGKNNTIHTASLQMKFRSFKGESKECNFRHTTAIFTGTLSYPAVHPLLTCCWWGLRAWFWFDLLSCTSFSQLLSEYSGLPRYTCLNHEPLFPITAASWSTSDPSHAVSEPASHAITVADENTLIYHNSHSLLH